MVACINFPGYSGDVIPSVSIGAAMGMNMSARAKHYMVYSLNNTTSTMSVFRDEEISSNYRPVEFKSYEHGISYRKF